MHACASIEEWAWGNGKAFSYYWSRIGPLLATLELQSSGKWCWLMLPGCLYRWSVVHMRSLIKKHFNLVSILSDPIKLTIDKKCGDFSSRFGFWIWLKSGHYPFWRDHSECNQLEMEIIRHWTSRISNLHWRWWLCTSFKRQIPSVSVVDDVGVA